MQIGIRFFFSFFLSKPCTLNQGMSHHLQSKYYRVQRIVFSMVLTKTGYLKTFKQFMRVHTFCIQPIRNKLNKYCVHPLQHVHEKVVVVYYLVIVALGITICSLFLSLSCSYIYKMMMVSMI